MDNLNVVGKNNIMVPVNATALESLRSSLRGNLLFPGDNGYEKSRTVWNAMIDRRPALVIRCAGVADIRQAVRFARNHGLLTAIKGGGHNIAGNAVGEGGLLIDLTNMRSVTVDPLAKVAHVEPGATLADVDHECQAFGLATPLGINSTTGVAGLTLGGGFGWLSRQFGMTIDNLLAADVMHDATAYSHRDAIYVCNVHGRWETAAEDQPCIDWARGFFRDATPFATGGVYVNFLTDDEVDRIRAAYGPGYDRLVAIKKKYDPDNLFRMNQNIRPDA